MRSGFAMRKNLDFHEFQQHFQSIKIIQGKRPFAEFPASAARYFAETVAPLRTRQWASSQQWGKLAESTGLLGELGVFSLMGFSAEFAFKSFHVGLGGSDSGVDFTWAGENVDVKATRGQALKFKLSKTNPNAHRASILLFSAVQELSCGGVRVQALGWSWRHEIGPWIRDDERYRFCRFETLDREGLVYTLDALTALAKG
jgi:hypothetical protein